MIQFLSYEGMFTATEGAANGLSSEQIGVEEDNSTAVSDRYHWSAKWTILRGFSLVRASDSVVGAINGVK